MRILHTSDWHLGKFLEGSSRIEEQKMFMEELYYIVENKNIDLIIVAGDIYDTPNPPANAEKLFYKEATRLSKNGKIPIIIIAGNHDSPDRLSAAVPLAEAQGIIILGTPKSIVEVSEYDNYSILSSGEGWFEILLNDEKAIIAAMPYPSERRLNELISEDLEEVEMQKAYSTRVGELFNKLSVNFREDTINLAVGHFYVTGGAESGSERPIQLGGSLAVNACDLPKEAQYIALGHLHRPQTVGGTNKKAYYSGSPIQYSKDEAAYSKSVNIVDVKAGEEMNMEKYLLKNYKPIECWSADSIEDAIEMCEVKKHENSWVYLSINTDRTLELSEIKKIKITKKDVLEIIAVFKSEEITDEKVLLEYKNIKEQFNEFYALKRGISPTEETSDLFLSMLEDKENSDETYNS